MAHSPSEMGVVGTRACDEVESCEKSRIMLLMMMMVAREIFWPG